MLAVSTYQTNLDAVSQALWDRDLAQILRHIALPNMMLTEDAELVISSADEMQIVATEFRDHLDRLGADAYVRICRQAAFVPGSRTMIMGMHDTFILRDGVPVIAPLKNRMTLLLIDGCWRGARLEVETRNTDCPILSPDLAAAQRRELQRLGAGSTAD
jgi:hypothetical protein